MNLALWYDVLCHALLNYLAIPVCFLADTFAFLFPLQDVTALQAKIKASAPAADAAPITNGETTPASAKKKAKADSGAKQEPAQGNGKKSATSTPKTKADKAATPAKDKAAVDTKASKTGKAGSSPKAGKASKAGKSA